MGALAGVGIGKRGRKGDEEWEPVRVSLMERLVSVIESENRATRETFVAQSEHTRRVLHDLDTRIQVLGALLEDVRMALLDDARLARLERIAKAMP
jgi:hypothetical protein